MKTFLVALTLVATLASAPFASAQQPDEVVAKTHWSYEVLKKLTSALDINQCRDDTQIRYTDFDRDDFRFNRRQAALAMWQILNRLRRLKDKGIVITYERKNDIGNNFDSRHIETKEAVLALFLEYKDDYPYKIDEKWIQKNVIDDLGLQTSVQEPDLPQTHWSYEALATICGGLDFDSYSWLHFELYGGRTVRPISLTRSEIALLIVRIIEKTKVEDSFNDRASKVQQLREPLEIVDLMAALQTEFAPEIARFDQRI